MNYWVLVYRFACSLLIVLIVIGVMFVFVPRYRQLRELQRKRAGLEQTNRELLAQAEELRDKQRLFRTEPAFVELVAREAGMVMTNEVIYRLDNGRTN